MKSKAKMKIKKKTLRKDEECPGCSYYFEHSASCCVPFQSRQMPSQELKEKCKWKNANN